MATTANTQVKSPGNGGPFELRMVRLSTNQFRLQLTNVSGGEAQNIRFQLFLLETRAESRQLKLDFSDVEVLEPGAKSILLPTDKCLLMSEIDQLLVRLTREGADGKNYELRIFFEHPEHAHQIIPLGAGSNLSFPRK